MNLPPSQRVILNRETLEASSQAKDIKYSHYLFNKVSELQPYKIIMRKNERYKTWKEGMKRFDI